MPDATTVTRSFTAVACVDASLVIRVLDAPRHPEAFAAWRRLVDQRVDLIAPSLLGHEVTNALYQQQRAGTISADVARDGLQRVLALPIGLHGDAALHVRALELAGKHRLPATYDAHYLALAERYRVPLWTCDRRLHEAVGERLPWVHLAS
ncbi:MAG: type II toxin-antitoxin system VapC family toxin [Actinomycetota bacterium]|nr:type II toxin-antitoxin system VapC family toxin [Actinomycetota bacterium]